YGMTELSSQLYDGRRVEGCAAPGLFRPPPWMRVVAVDPETHEALPDGREGLARFIDLANVDSALVVQTSDRVRVTSDGVALLGRAAGAEPRGCSLTIEELAAG